MKTVVLVIFLFLAVGTAFLVVFKPKTQEKITPKLISEVKKQTEDNTNQDFPQAVTIASGLDTPWGIAFLPNKNILFTQRDGLVKLIDVKDNYKLINISTINNAQEIGEGGLLGIAIHPEYETNNFVYFYYTYQANGENTLNKVSRFTFKDNSLQNEEIIIDQIPGARNHNGGRIKFGPDKMLYVATGDAQEPSLAQNTQSLAGKILKVTPDGNPVENNPFKNRIYSYGHRNTQGFAWDKNGNIWQVEHGRSAPTGYDEINKIEPGQNYGWPTIQGEETRSGMLAPIRNSGPTNTWAPAGAAFVENSFFFSGLRGQALFEAVITDDQVTDFKEHFKGQLGRIRDVVTGPDGALYITTSNRDGRGSPAADDDKIIRVNTNKLK